MWQNPPIIQQFFVKYRQIPWQKGGKNVELVFIQIPNILSKDCLVEIVVKLRSADICQEFSAGSQFF
jgi:hypothetical protein